MTAPITVRLLVLVALLGACVSACGSGGHRAGDPARRSNQLTIPQAMQIAYDAGFRTEAQLTAMVGIGIAESSLVTNARKWHPEYGYRPATDVIGVQGPKSAWNANHTQQLNSDRGVWQISSHFWPQYRDAQTDDPAQAARVAWVISKQGTNFTPWDTYKVKVAQRHATAAFDGWPAVQPLVREFLASKR
jgi:Lysozyme like domain